MDVEDVLEDVDFVRESTDSVRVIPFSIMRPGEYYYIQLRFILFRFKDGKHYAQVENFFFGRRTLPLLDDISGIVLPVEWPSIPLEELGIYGLIKPSNR